MPVRVECLISIVVWKIQISRLLLDWCFHVRSKNTNRKENAREANSKSLNSLSLSLTPLFPLSWERKLSKLAQIA